MQPDNPKSTYQLEYFTPNLLHSTLSLGSSHSCVTYTKSRLPLKLLPNKYLSCWGDNQQNQLNTPEFIQSRVNQVSAGLDHTCVLQYYNQKQYCFGNNNQGQSDIPEYVPLNYSSYKNNNQIVAGTEYTCIIYSDQQALICFGTTTKYLTISFDTNASNNSFLSAFHSINSPLLSNITSVSLGGAHGCQVTPFQQYNKLHCWGDNEQGQSTIPNGYEVGIIQVDLGWVFSCGVQGDKITCWGGNSRNQLEYPKQIIDTPELYDSIAVGDFHVCAKSGGKTDIICWGDSTESVVKDTPKIQTETKREEQNNDAQVDGDGLDDDNSYDQRFEFTRQDQADGDGLIDDNSDDQRFEFTRQDQADGDGLIDNNSDDQRFEFTRQDSKFTTAIYDGDILTSVEYISAGFSHNCGIFKTLSKLSKVLCWGQNEKGQTLVPDLDSEQINRKVGNGKVKDEKWDDFQGLFKDLVKDLNNEINVYDEQCKGQQIPIKKSVLAICFSLVLYNVSYRIYTYKDLQKMSNCTDRQDVTPIANDLVVKTNNIETCKLKGNDILVKETKTDSSEKIKTQWNNYYYGGIYDLNKNIYNLNTTENITKEKGIRNRIKNIKNQMTYKIRSKFAFMSKKEH